MCNRVSSYSVTRWGATRYFLREPCTRSNSVAGRADKQGDFADFLYQRYPRTSIKANKKATFRWLLDFVKRHKSG